MFVCTYALLPRNQAWLIGVRIDGLIAEQLQCDDASINHSWRIFSNSNSDDENRNTGVKDAWDEDDGGAVKDAWDEEETEVKDSWDAEETPKRKNIIFSFSFRTLNQNKSED